MKLKVPLWNSLQRTTVTHPESDKCSQSYQICSTVLLEKSTVG